MSKIKYLVAGINSEVLSSVVGTLATGELAGDSDLICCQGFPKAYKIGSTGHVVEMSFDTLLTELVRNEKKRRNLAAPPDSIDIVVREVVKGSLKVMPSEG